MAKEKNPTTDLAKVFFNRIFNYKAWIDLNRTKEISYYFLNVIKKILIPRKIDQTTIKSFDTVMQEMSLTEEDITKKAVTFKRMYLLMLFGAMFFYTYALYQILYGGALGALIATVVAFVCLALAFRYHFWYFQIKKRKLGCTLKEWFSDTFMDGGR